MRRLACFAIVVGAGACGRQVALVRAADAGAPIYTETVRGAAVPASPAPPPPSPTTEPSEGPGGGGAQPGQSALDNLGPGPASGSGAATASGGSTTIVIVPMQGGGAVVGGGGVAGTPLVGDGGVQQNGAANTIRDGGLGTQVVPGASTSTPGTAIEPGVPPTAGTPKNAGTFPNPGTPPPAIAPAPPNGATPTNGTGRPRSF